jgi:hypothetical protein
MAVQGASQASTTTLTGLSAPVTSGSFGDPFPFQQTTTIAVCNDIDPLPLCPLMCRLADNLGFLRFALTSKIRGGGSTAMTTAVESRSVNHPLPRYRQL